MSRDESDGSDLDGADLDKVRPKLVETKERWAATGRGRVADRPVGQSRLPPGQHLVKDWPVLDLGVQPDIPVERWSLRVDGLVEAPFTWDWQAFLAQPQITDVSDMHCVTTWSRFENRWRGVRIRDVLSQAQPRPEAQFAILHGADGYTTNLPLAYLMTDDALIVHEWEGRPIAREHGGPVRALIPRLYLWKSAKWLNRIELIPADRAGFWEQRGYHDRGDPWTEERYR